MPNETSGQPVSGRCLCGAVAFAAGPALYPATLCHCESCRRASGAHAVGWVTVEASSLSWPRAAPKAFQSSTGVTRTFCAACGSPLTYQNARRPGEIDVTIGSLDEPGNFAPTDHLWMEDAVTWDRPEDGLPQWPQSRPG